LLIDAKLLTTLYAYNPYGNNYTLFLPTDEAIDRFLSRNQQYANFDELIKDTTFVKMIMRYHIINGSYETNQFPDGAFMDTTLTGHRLVASFFARDNKQLIRINNVSSIVKANLEMTNGYIHVVSELLQPIVISGYTWLQQQSKYSILARAVKLSGVRERLTWAKYSLWAEPDSVYNVYGIYTVEDLISHIATPGMALNNEANEFYKFAAYHFMNGEYFLNDLDWGSRDYLTLSGQKLTVNIGREVEINTGIDNYLLSTSLAGDSTFLTYIRPITEKCNILTRTGAVHSITDLLYNKPLPKGMRDIK